MAKWGFLKNIINIDTFFASGAKNGKSQSLAAAQACRAGCGFCGNSCCQNCGAGAAAVSPFGPRYDDRVYNEMGGRVVHQTKHVYDQALPTKIIHT